MRSRGLHQQFRPAGSRPSRVMPSAEYCRYVVLGAARRWSDHHAKIDGWQTPDQNLADKPIDLDA